jgi:hypothetical protein
MLTNRPRLAKNQRYLANNRPFLLETLQKFCSCFIVHDCFLLVP